VCSVSEPLHSQLLSVFGTCCESFVCILNFFKLLQYDCEVIFHCFAYFCFQVPDMSISVKGFITTYSSLTDPHRYKCVSACTLCDLPLHFSDRMDMNDIRSCKLLWLQCVLLCMILIRLGYEAQFGSGGKGRMRMPIPRVMTAFKAMLSHDWLFLMEKAGYMAVDFTVFIVFVMYFIFLNLIFVNFYTSYTTTVIGFINET
jgi:hypothetical protein